MIEKIRKMNNFDLLNKIFSNELDEITMENMRSSIKSCLIESDEMHSAVFQTATISDAHEKIDLTEKLLSLSENVSDFFTAITIFSDTYCNKLNGMSSNEPTKVVGFLKSEINSLKSQVEAEKTKTYDNSTVIGSIVVCVACILAIGALYFFAPISNLFTAESLYGLSVTAGAIAFIIGMFTVGPIVAFILVAIFGFIFVNLNNILPLGMILKVLITIVLAIVAFACVSLIHQELEKKKSAKANESSARLNQLKIEAKRDLIVSYVDYLIQRLNKFKDLMASSFGQEYYEKFAEKFSGITADQLRKQDLEILSVALKYYRYVLKEVNKL